MSSPLEQLQVHLQQNNFSVTNVRRSVFEYLASSEPISIAELVKKLPTIDRASIYRTLALFEQLSIVQRIPVGWKYKIELTDTFHEHHHHLICIKCGSIIDTSEDARIESMLQNIAHTHGFKMTAHQLEIQGVCQSCSSKAL